MSEGFENMTGRKLTMFATDEAKHQLEVLLTAETGAYRSAMVELGYLLAKALMTEINVSMPNSTHHEILMVSTAEDADFLQRGINQTLSRYGIPTKLAVFWNHHYQLSDNSSVAPIVHQYLQTGFETATTLVVVKSIISGSCVVRTNLIELMDSLPNLQDIYILAPVMHKDAQHKLKAEFPEVISDKFRFITFAIDAQRTKNGEVLPGIGGQVYERLGLSQQPVLTGYLPEVVKQMAFKV